MNRQTFFLVFVLAIIAVMFASQTTCAENFKVIQKQPLPSAKPPTEAEPTKQDLQLAPGTATFGTTRIKDLRMRPYQKDCVPPAMPIINLEAADAAGYVENHDPGIGMNQGSLATWCKEYGPTAFVLPSDIDVSAAWVCVDNRENVTIDPSNPLNICAGDGAASVGGGHFLIPGSLHTHCCYPKYRAGAGSN